MHPHAGQQWWKRFGPANKATNDIAREIGKMDPNDPLRPGRIKRTSRANRTQQVHQSRTEQVHLCEDGRSCKRGGRVEAEDAHRADVVNEIIRLSHLILK